MQAGAAKHGIEQSISSANWRMRLINFEIPQRL
jgi:hypothetical protein